MKPPLTKPDYFEEKIAGVPDKSLYKKYNINHPRLRVKKKHWGFEGYTREDFAKLKKIIKEGQAYVGRAAL